MAPDSSDIPIREHLTDRIVALERLLDREIAATHRLMTEHAQAHDREHKATVLANDMAQRGIDERFVELRRAVDKYEAAINDRFASANEFRGTLTDQTATFVRRDFLDQAIGAMATRTEVGLSTLRAEMEKSRTRVDELEKERRYLDGRIWGISAGIGGVVTLLSLALRFLPGG